MPARRKHIPKETLQYLYLEQGLSPRKIGLRLGCGETAVRKRLKEYNIPMRSRSQAIRLGKGIIIERETLVELYWGQDLSIPEVAARLDCSEDVVRSRMQEYEIPRRTPSESAQLSRGIDLPEDLAREWYTKQQLSTAAIAERLGCSETAVRNKLAQYGIKRRAPWAHNAVELMHDLFDRYGHVYEHHRADAKVFMQVRLNNSFSFLVPKEDRIPDWVLADEECFFAFLAGYVDAEGSIQVDRRGFARFNLNSYDKILLAQAQAKLVEVGVICPPLRLDVPAGRCNSYGIINREDYWGFSVHKKTSLDILFARLGPYLKHRKRRQDLQCAWESIKERMKKRKSLC